MKFTEVVGPSKQATHGCAHLHAVTVVWGSLGLAQARPNYQEYIHHTKTMRVSHCTARLSFVNDYWPMEYNNYVFSGVYVSIFCGYV